MTTRPLVVISYYDRRSPADLLALLATLKDRPSGCEYDVTVVVNHTGAPAFEAPARLQPFTVLRRENLGMNIGAWEHGWRAARGRSAYLFLQDECRAVRDTWLQPFVSAACEPDVGLVGESLNAGWSHSWDQLGALHAGDSLPEHYVDGHTAPRVDTYLHHMRRWGVDPGLEGTHLRALVWAARGRVLDRLGGFPVGANYGECIAAEIAVSRKVVTAGLRLVQVHEAPFHWFRHTEWNQDRPGGPFAHSRKPQVSPSPKPSARAQFDGQAEAAAFTVSEAGDEALREAVLRRKLELCRAALADLKAAQKA